MLPRLLTSAARHARWPGFSAFALRAAGQLSAAHISTTCRQYSVFRAEGTVGGHAWKDADDATQLAARRALRKRDAARPDDIPVVRMGLSQLVSTHPGIKARLSARNAEGKKEVDRDSRIWYDWDIWLATLDEALLGLLQGVLNIRTETALQDFQEQYYELLRENASGKAQDWIKRDRHTHDDGMKLLLGRALPPSLDRPTIAKIVSSFHKLLQDPSLIAECKKKVSELPSEMDTEDKIQELLPIIHRYQLKVLETCGLTPSAESWLRVHSSIVIEYQHDSDIGYGGRPPVWQFAADIVENP